MGRQPAGAEIFPGVACWEIDCCVIYMKTLTHYHTSDAEGNEGQSDLHFI